MDVRGTSDLSGELLLRGEKVFRGEALLARDPLLDRGHADLGGEGLRLRERLLCRLLRGDAHLREEDLGRECRLACDGDRPPQDDRLREGERLFDLSHDLGRGRSPRDLEGDRRPRELDLMIGSKR